MRIAYFSPFPPAPSGIADYSAELVPYLSQLADVTLFVSREQPLDPSLAGLPVQDVAAWPACQVDFDMALYHMGNDVTYHEMVYQAMRAVPGVVVLHETVFYHFFHLMTVSRGATEAFQQILETVYGPAQARQVLVHLDDWEHIPYRFPLLAPVLENARGVIVHSDFARRQVQQVRPDLPVQVIPHHFHLPARLANRLDREAVRRHLGVENRFVVGSFGLVTPVKRPAVILRAFAELQRTYPVALLWFVGAEAAGCDVAGLAARIGLPDTAVRVTGRLSLEEFLCHMLATDVAVNLRFPTSGETSGAVTRLLGLGVPTIVSDVGAFADWPDHICAKVPVDAWEEELLAALLRELATNPDLAAAMGENARRHIQTYHTLTGSARTYLSFLAQVVSGTAPPVGPPARSPFAEVLSTIGATLAGWGITEQHETLLRPIAEALAEWGVDTDLQNHGEPFDESWDL